MRARTWGRWAAIARRPAASKRSMCSGTGHDLLVAGSMGRASVGRDARRDGGGDPGRERADASAAPREGDLDGEQRLRASPQVLSAGTREPAAHGALALLGGS